MVDSYYSFIAFDERVTFWLQRIQSLPCASAYFALFVRRLGYTMQQTRTHKAVTRRFQAKKLLSRRRQSEYRRCSMGVSRRYSRIARLVKELNIMLFSVLQTDLCTFNEFDAGYSKMSPSVDQYVRFCSQDVKFKLYLCSGKIVNVFHCSVAECY